MRIDIVTLFPNMFSGPFDESIIRRAREKEFAEILIHNLRDYGLGRHRVVDDYPYGGGSGMVLMPEPLFSAVEAIKGESRIPVILLTPQGRLFTQQVAEELAAYSRFILVCGHYEGVDERVREYLVTDEISIGDYVLTGGEPAAMVVCDAVVRLIPGVLGSPESVRDDSHSGGLLEYPQYTRPQIFRGWEVPPVLLSGNHAEIARWRREQAVLRTLARRPDLLEKADR
ncbi:tRNA (guanosine(37)-N1)-methyltransferase TrmD [Dehalococcoidia bacterium]|nr:tRNA (guanosine(37)-N1)-methyltransferase TrmD [Dehalococcoidia bacterium]MCL0092763.1 tRNA (guanosine(37)-N1)-methyltransferase TrmD [Dehalococcoidia bacterium]MCL0103376.1 tRNA (guanosine(37)-N1)-methyltransferase TrmD [Dehalococcoidia bacterium]MCL0104479.1 tRNA (guanosine(37)-N1)-methyltransferase TrmD [Dehalococcoidia bacterium]